MTRPLESIASSVESIASSVAAEESLRSKRHRLRRVASKLLPHERVKGCGHKRTSQTVDVHRSATGAHFVGVETCGSVWHCPVCAAKVAEKRREEVATAIEGAKDEGGASYMLTLTMCHDRADKLAFLKEIIANSWRAVQNRRAYRALKARLSVRGTVRALEVTHGKANGWHPHLHILFVAKRPLCEHEIEETRLALYEIWSDVLGKRADRYVALDALDFRPAHASDYVTKWGADRELVKGQQKDGHGSRTPWQLLEDYQKGDRWAGRLFKEYAHAFKGARQLTWSKGLKDHFCIGEISDEEAAQKAEEASPELPLSDGMKEGRIGTLDARTFDAVYRLNLTASVLDAAHEGGWQGVCDLLSRHGLKNALDDSWSMPQPPKPSKPSHPKYYVKCSKEDFLGDLPVHGPGNTPNNTGGRPGEFPKP